MIRTTARGRERLNALLAARILVQEAGVLWYGYDLSAKAQDSAARIADGSAYCVKDSFGTVALAELPTREILLQAFDNRFGFGDRTFFTEPHFMIAVNGASYWWSFRQQQFVPVPLHFSGTLPPRECPTMID